MSRFRSVAIALSAGIVTTSMMAIASPPVSAQPSEYESFQLTPGFLPDPQMGRGLSGGGLAIRPFSNCSITTYINANRPDHILTVISSFDFLRASVEADGDVTLVIDGPNGRLCSDDVNGLQPEISGSWPSGTYYIWIGDFEGDPSGTYQYQLFLSEFAD